MKSFIIMSLGACAIMGSINMETKTDASAENAVLAAINSVQKVTLANNQPLARRVDCCDILVPCCDAGPQGVQGVQGAQGAQGMQGIQGSVGLAGVGGLTGFTGMTGLNGAMGATGSVGTVLDYAVFFALMPPNNAATVAPGAAVEFPQNGIAFALGIVRSGPGTFVLQAVGTYEVHWQVSVDEAGQLQLALNAVGLPETVVGRATGTNQICGSMIIATTTINTVLTVINPVGNSTALTITPLAGGAHPVSATLTIKRLL